MKGFILCSVLLMGVMVVGCGKAEVVDIEIGEEVIKDVTDSEQEVTEEEITEAEEEINLISLLGKSKESVIELFPDDNPIVTDDLYNPQNLYFPQQNFVITFDDNNRVDWIVAYEGNNVLGVEIGESYDEDHIVSVLGPSRTNDPVEWSGKKINRIVYFLTENIEDKPIFLVFYDDYRRPFSAVMYLEDYYYWPDYMFWTENQILDYFGDTDIEKIGNETVITYDKIQFTLRDNEVQKIHYFDGNLYAIQIGNKYSKEELTKKFGQPEIWNERQATWWGSMTIFFSEEKIDSILVIR